MFNCQINVRVQAEDFAVESTYQQLLQQSPDCGALCFFVGKVRQFQPDDSGQSQQQTSALLLEHYPGMTEGVLQQLAEQAAKRWPLQHIHLIHRTGLLGPNEQIVLVAVSSPHRADSFAATEFLMDQLKSQAPFWKKQQNQQQSQWLESKDSDLAAARRWYKPEQLPLLLKQKATDARP
ncbi:MAG: molybdenum cofactor biosynthesis protein MoaE [Gammaproteobacteria bacterium]|nr:molybdenum cofactor biosynthesis protein MoaE [Gammaproteobacteria bacterium]MBU2056465.1 molybdenum cofactor biosynthesis protein MoaE [Gammaproteobacteria bacterium]MBU2173822.1 molybdenum cofactor biosynthesis protein MoaE [Gammaproteobacteria bacterium]MBU2248885.1 molybdenum cofactor biosynthesis protein MoaE [Gammaproteobacteria bacterium]MBU2344007.1 molybdenum cofactor biosynthesis protein MoaE [Gammaproteobacteria bacterium]